MRICVERCFGKIFGQWRLLRKQRYFPGKTRMLATCAVIIHNFVIDEELREGAASTDGAVDAATAQAAERTVVDNLAAMLDVSDVDDCERTQILEELEGNIDDSSAPELMSTVRDDKDAGPRADLPRIHAVDAGAEFNPASIARSSSAITRRWVESQERKGLPAVDDGLGVACPVLPGGAADSMSRERVRIKRSRRRQLARALMDARHAFEAKTGTKDAEYRVASARLVTAGRASFPQPKARRTVAQQRPVRHRPKRVARPDRAPSEDSESGDSEPGDSAGWDSEAESEGSAGPGGGGAASNPATRTQPARVAAQGSAAAVFAAKDSDDDEG
jgi:hypothetical protein